MTGKFVAILMLLCVSQLTLGDDLAKEKEEAVEKIKSLIRAVDEAYRKTCDVYHKRPSYLYPIKDRLRDLGESLWEMSIMEVNQTVLEIKQKAKLEKESPKVNECVQTKAEETLNRLKKSFEDYKKTLEDFLRKGIDRRQWWADRYSDRFSGLRWRVGNDASIAEDEINATNSKVYLVSVLKAYEEFIAEALKITLSLESMFVNNEINFDRTLQNGPVKTYRIFTRKIVDDFIQSVNKCNALV